MLSSLSLSLLSPPSPSLSPSLSPSAYHLWIVLSRLIRAVVFVVAIVSVVAVVSVTHFNFISVSVSLSTYSLQCHDWFVLHLYAAGRKRLLLTLLHDFIKRHVISRANITCLTVVPKDISVCTRNKTKKDAVNHVVLKLSSMFGKGRIQFRQQKYKSLKNFPSFPLLW